jgi:hypothetical protein
MNHLEKSQIHPSGNDSSSPRDTDQRWEMVNRMASSASFRNSPRLRQFLLFIAERSLTGHSQEINEHEIGWKVFGRAENYNTLEDSIVRSAARQLRTKIREYFDSEGRDETWRLEIPKGHYAPIFTERGVDSPVATAPAPAPTAPGTHLWKALTAILATAIIVLAATTYRIWRQLEDFRRGSGLTIASTVLSEAGPTKVVIGDYGAVLMSVITKHVFSVEEYANRSYPQSLLTQAKTSPIRELWDGFTNGHAVYFPDAAIAGAILRLSGEERKKIIIQHARQTGVQDLRSGNLILISSTLATPWINLLTDSLDFRYHVQFDTNFPPGLPEFLNIRPLPGERSSYSADPRTPGFGVTYGLVARVPNLSGTGKILIIQGLRYTGSQAAGEFATDPTAAADLARVLHVGQVNDLPDFEALLQTDSIANSHLNTKLVAFRRLRR